MRVLAVLSMLATGCAPPAPPVAPPAPPPVVQMPAPPAEPAPIPPRLAIVGHELQLDGEVVGSIEEAVESKRLIRVDALADALAAHTGPTFALAAPPDIPGVAWLSVVLAARDAGFDRLELAPDTFVRVTLKKGSARAVDRPTLVVRTGNRGMIWDVLPAPRDTPTGPAAPTALAEPIIEYCRDLNPCFQRARLLASYDMGFAILLDTAQAMREAGRSLGVERETDLWVRLATIRDAAGQEQSRGRLPPAVIQETIRGSFDQFRACYEQGLKRDPNLVGRLVVRFVIGEDGSVTATEPRAEQQGDVPAMADAEVVACIGREVQGLTFPEPEGGRVSVSYPLIFTPGG